MVLPSKFRNSYARAKLWPNGIVPYEIDTSIQSDSTRLAALTSAIQEYHKQTCLKWIRKSSADVNYVRFMDGGPLTCYSFAGMIGGPQNLSIGLGCERAIGVILHEMAHALSFMHEHTRPDRDQYVTVVASRISDGRSVMFDKLAQNDSILNNLSYDYSSMMHYGSTSFSKDGVSPTIITVDPNAQDVIGQREGFSVCDREKINTVYGCTSKLTKDTSCQTKIASVTTTTIAPIAQLQCVDDKNFAADCSKAATNRNLCQEKPGLYSFYCIKTCNNCNSNYCKDTTTPQKYDCRRVRAPCNNNLQDGYNCPKSCGWCT